MTDRKEYLKKFYLDHKEDLQKQFKASYKLNKKARLTYQNRYYTENKQKLLRTLSIRKDIIKKAKDRPCMDCAHRYPSYVMQFDHRDPTKKLFAIGSVGNGSIQRLQVEIAKCDVVCANCHAERTWGPQTNVK